MLQISADFNESMKNNNSTVEDWHMVQTNQTAVLPKCSYYKRKQI